MIKRFRHLFPLFRFRPFHAGASALTLAVLMGGCGGEKAAGPPPADEGIWISDTAFALDEIPFSTSACAEVFPAGSTSVDSVPDGSVAHVRVRSRSCYAVRLKVISPDSDTVRVIDQRFGIFFRNDEDKNRAQVGFLSWDGKDDGGRPVAPGEYLWRMEFDFGEGRTGIFGAAFTVP